MIQNNQSRARTFIYNSLLLTLSAVLMRAVGVAFEAGKSTVKLYFMMGLPTETDEDIEGIATLATHVIDKYYQMPNHLHIN